MLRVPLSGLVKELLLLGLEVALAHLLFMFLGVSEALFAWVFTLDPDLGSAKGYDIIVAPCYTAKNDLLGVTLDRYDPIGF